MKELWDFSTGISMLAPIITVLSIFVEVTPFKIKPLSLILQWLSNVMNKEIRAKLNDIEIISAENRNNIKKMNENIETRFDGYERANLKQQAEQMREHIIYFSENIKLGRRYSCKQFEYILGLISKYEKHCDINNIPNHYIDEVVKFIEKSHLKCVFNEDGSEE